MTKQTKLLALEAAAVIAAAIAAIVLLHIEPARTSATAQHAAPHEGRVVPAEPVALGAARVAAYVDRGETGLSTDDPLTAYRRANVYPPNSHPLTRDHDDLLHPNQRHEIARVMDDDADVKFLFTADRYFVIGDGALHATLDVRKDVDATPVAVRITGAYAVVLDPSKPDAAGMQVPLAFTGAGGSWAATFAPASLSQLSRQTTIGMYIEFAVPPTSAGREFETGHARQHAHFDFQYTPASGIPARFTGELHDELEGGSLVIHAGVAVARGGRYLIDCNLYDASDEPVGWSRFQGDLAEGAATADLQFFGKVIADAKASGPFHIGELRGARFDPGVDPDLEQMLPFAGSYATAAYPATAFSDADYDSPQKQQMIELLSQEQSRGVHLGAAGGPR